jgi:peptide methionine sulfoxide reductase MsrA
VQVVKVVKVYKDADEALDSVSERLAKRALAMQEKQGKSAEQFLQEVNSKTNHTAIEETHQKYFASDSSITNRVEEEANRGKNKQERAEVKAL